MQDTNKTELQLQRDICVEVWNTLPETRHCLYHIKQELDAKLTPQQMIMLSQQKASGLLPGIQDLHFLWNGVTYRIELKRPGGDTAKSVSPAQKIIHAAHARQGSLTWLFNDSDRCIKFIRFIVERNNSMKNPILNNDYFQTILKENFACYISPFAVGTMYEQYLSEYEQWVAKQKEQRKMRNNARFVNIK